MAKEKHFGFIFHFGTWILCFLSSLFLCCRLGRGEFQGSQNEICRQHCVSVAVKQGVLGAFHKRGCRSLPSRGGMTFKLPLCNQLSNTSETSAPQLTRAHAHNAWMTHHANFCIFSKPHNTSSKFDQFQQTDIWFLKTWQNFFLYFVNSRRFSTPCDHNCNIFC